MRWAAALLAALAVARAPAALAQDGHTPAEALARMTVPPGFAVRLFACEPEIRQPVAMEFDDRGRLWVIQYLQYPNPAGLKRVAWDRYSRTTYDRVPEPPPRGPRGADRITICEDTDGDGRADRFRDFVDGLNLATGLAFGHGGVYVLQVPYLLFYPDVDGDDVPDGDPRVLLAGFGMEDAHSVANSLVWGPDGWLYGAQGSTVTAHIRGIEFQQGVWRYHPATDRFELYYEGGGNTWGVDFDAEGNLLACTNVGGYALLHGVPGGYYWKSFGKHGELHNPHAYGYFEHITHAGLTGAHVTCGGVVYQEGAFPEQFRGAVVAANLLSHRVDWHTLAPAGSTFTARQAGTLLDAHDAWFAPCDVTIGPEGAVYVADWSDQRTAHPDPDAEWDRTNGRVYVVEAEGTRRPAAFDLRAATTDNLIALLETGSPWFRRRARRILAQRDEAEIAGSLWKRFSVAEDSQRRRELLWTVLSRAEGGEDSARIVELLENRDANVRRWTARWVSNQFGPAEGIVAAARTLAEREQDPAVRVELAALARRLPGERGLSLVAALLTARDDAGDAFLPLLLWWAIEPHSVTDVGLVRELLLTRASWQKRMFAEQLAPRLARRWAAEGTAETLAALAALLHGAPEGSVGALVAGANAGLSRDAEMPAELKAWIDGRWDEATNDEELLRFAGLLGDARARARARGLMLEREAPVELRIAAVELVGRLQEQDDVPALLSLVGGDEDAAAQAAALGALAAYDDPRVAAELVRRYAALTTEARRGAIDLLLTRRASATALLEAVDSGTIAAADVPVAALQELARHQDARIDELVRKHWGRLGPTSPGELLAEVRRLNNDLRAATGDPGRGRLLFREHCAKCHRLFDEGQPVGPDLTAANRQDRDYLLLQLVDPSAVVRKEYLSYLVETDDGRSLTGLVVEQSPQQVVLFDAQANRVPVAAASIVAMEPAPRSLMPERVLEKLAPQEVRDLFSFLQASEAPGR